MHSPIRSSLRSLFFASLSACVLTASASLMGCSAPGDDDDEATSASQLSSADMTAARRSIALIAGSEAHCNHCHDATQEDIQRWGERMQAVEKECFARKSASAEDRIECLKDVPNDPKSSFSAAVTHKAIRGLFEPDFDPALRAETGESSQNERYLSFKNQAAMPMRGQPMSEDEFAVVKRWVLDGMPKLSEAMAELPPVDGRSAH